MVNKMDEKFVDARNSVVVKEAKKIILEFMDEYFSTEGTAKAKEVFESSEIYFVDRDFFSRSGVRGECDKDSGNIYLLSELNRAEFYIDTEDLEGEDALHTVIHEFAHAFRRANSEFGHKFEEGFAETFTRMCMVNSKIKRLPNRDKNMLQPSIYCRSSADYEKAESQISAIMYVLSKQGLENQLLEEYLLGSQETFKQKCIEIFGKDFDEYFELASSSNDEYYNNISNENLNSEAKLVRILSQYIKDNNLSIKDYADHTCWLLFSKNSKTMALAVDEAGIEFLGEDEKRYFKYFETTAKNAKQEEIETFYGKKNKVKTLIAEEYNLSGKSKEEIYRISQKICGEYFKRKFSKEIENTTFIEEIKKLIPDIESFANEMIELNYYSLSTSFLDNVDLENITFENIVGVVDSTFKELKQKELINKIKNKFEDCTSKEELLTRIEEVKEYTELIDVSQVLPDFEDFEMFVNDLKEQIPESFEQTREWNYESLYKELSKRYVIKKEKELVELRKLEKQCKNNLQGLGIRYNVLKNEETYLKFKNQNEVMQSKLKAEKSKVQKETQGKENEELEKEKLFNKKDKLGKKNFLIRFFYSNEIKRLKKQIMDLENIIRTRNDNIQQINATIRTLETQITENEQQIINLSGLTIQRYGEVLEECKSRGVTQENLIDEGTKIKKRIATLGVEEREQEVVRLRSKQGYGIPKKQEQDLDI